MSHLSKSLDLDKIGLEKKSNKGQSDGYASLDSGAEIPNSELRLDMVSSLLNVGVGKNILTKLTTGDRNTALGNSALENITTQSKNVAIGCRALQNTMATGTVAIGEMAGLNSGNTVDSIFIGRRSGNNWISGNENIAIGTVSGDGPNTGNRNIMIGIGLAPLALDQSDCMNLGDVMISDLSEQITTFYDFVKINNPQVADGSANPMLSAASINKELTITGDLKVTGVITSSGAQTGNMSGPSSSTDNALVRFDGATGLLVQDSSATLDDAGTLTITRIAIDNLDIGLDPVFVSNSPTNELTLVGDLFINQSLRVGDKLTINNIGIGVNPVFSSNSLAQDLDFTGNFRISDNLIIKNKGAGDDPFIKSNSATNQLELVGDFLVDGSIQVDTNLIIENQGAGGSPKFSSNSPLDILDLQGTLDISADLIVGAALIINNLGAGFDPIFFSDSTNEELSLAGDLKVIGKVIIDNQGAGVNPILSSNATTQELDLTGDFKISGVLKSNTTNVATTGNIRLGNNESISWRNSTNTNNSSILIDDADLFTVDIDGITKMSISNTVMNIRGNNLVGVDFLETDAFNPATAGKLRLGNSEKISWRNVANTANISIEVDINNSLNIIGGQGINLENDHTINWANSDKRRILNDTIGFTFDVDVDDNFVYNINLTPEYTFDATQADWKGNNLVGVSSLTMSSTLDMTSFQQIRWGTNNLRSITNGTFGFLFEVEAGDAYDYAINGEVEYIFNETQADWKGNNLVGVNALTMANTLDMSDFQQIRWGGNDLRSIKHSQFGFFFGVETGDVFDFLVNAQSEYVFNSTQADWKGNSIINVKVFESNATPNPATVGTVRLGNGQTIRWRDSANSNDVIFGYTSDDKFEFKEGDRTLQLNLISQHTNTISGTRTGVITFVDNNSLAVPTTYGEIAVSIEEGTSGLERGDMKFQLFDGSSGLFENYIVLNDANDDAITMKKQMQIEDTIDFKKISEPSNPPMEEGRLYVRQIDGSNNGLFVKIKIAGSLFEVKLS